jgi:hypothetical protein
MTMPAIPTSVPTEIMIAATVKFRLAFDDYKATDGWALALYFRGAGAGLDIDGDLIVADGDGWLVTIPATASDDDPATANLAAGAYYWQAWVSKDDEDYEVDSGRVTVKPNLFDLDTGDSYDGRSAAKQTLDAIRAAMAKTATRAQLQRTIGDKHIQFMTMAELLIAKHGAPFLQNVHTRFLPRG